jgi:hypothetical protein
VFVSQSVDARSAQNLINVVAGAPELIRQVCAIGH